MTMDSKDCVMHPTIYGNLPDDKLYALYCGKSWFQMNETQRQQLLQETVNRAAAQKGEAVACEVRFADLDSMTEGKQSENIIILNRSAFVNDCTVNEYNGHIIERLLEDSNMRALETILHEDFHAWQVQCLDGTIPCTNPQQLTEYRANDFTVSQIPDGNGGSQTGLHYLSGVSGSNGYYIYYFQSTERDAYYYSQQHTMQIMASLQERYGDEHSFQLYQKNIELTGYAAMLEEGRSKFENDNFVREINQVLMNQYYGTEEKVDPVIKAMVQQEMIESYNNQIRNQQMEKEEVGEKDMKKEYTPVTLEDYDKSLRSSVNAFYEHAINDPSMSREEAISQTSQMAENYLNTMDEVAVEASESAPAAENNSAGIADGEGVDASEGGIE